MQRAVLADDGAAVDAYDVAIGEGLADDVHGLLVKVGLTVGGYEDGTVDDQIVGVGGGQPLGIVVVDGAGQGQAQQAVGAAVEGAQRL